ncbi:hypothetical protein V865_008315 [Kwoniella europaea PYCC6329]|uniref:Ribosome biogenesis protein SLX9 n=1 Tax=Kwoniella europaea PYCC6329 TaxID=1423913 RepID=A0AAX4KUR4_9TREE
MKSARTQTTTTTGTTFDSSTLDQLLFKTSQFKSLSSNGPTHILQEGGGSGPFIHPSRQVNLTGSHPTLTSIVTTQTNLRSAYHHFPIVSSHLGDRDNDTDVNRLDVSELGYDPSQPYFMNHQPQPQPQNHLNCNRQDPAQHQLQEKSIPSPITNHHLSTFMHDSSSVRGKLPSLSDSGSSKKNKVPMASASAGLGLTKNQKKKKARGNKGLIVQVNLSQKLEKKKNELKKKKADVPAPISVLGSMNINVEEHRSMKIPGQQLRDQLRAAKRRGLTLEEYLTRKGKIPVGSFDSMSFKEKLEKEKQRTDQLANELTRPSAKDDTKLNLLLKMIEHDPEIRDTFTRYTENTSTLEQNAKFRLYKRLGEIVDRF